jgi:peptidoglycan hydrolase CwlO-like protein
MNILLGHFIRRKELDTAHAMLKLANDSIDSLTAKNNNLESAVKNIEDSNANLHKTIDSLKGEITELEKGLINGSLLLKNRSLTESQSNNELMLSSQIAAQNELQSKVGVLIDENKASKTQCIALKVTNVCVIYLFDAIILILI